MLVRRLHSQFRAPDALTAYLPWKRQVCQLLPRRLFVLAVPSPLSSCSRLRQPCYLASSDSNRHELALTSPESKSAAAGSLIAMKTVTRFAFLATAVVFHLVYIFSIFDIYFVSPVVSGMRLFSVERTAPAKPPADRLVLFVGMPALSSSR